MHSKARFALYGLLWTLALFSLIWSPLLLANMAQEVRWSQFREALNTGVRQATAWRYAWGTAHTANLGWNLHLGSESAVTDTRFDARVNAVKSAIAVSNILLRPLPHPVARDRLETLYRQRDQHPGYAMQQAEELMRSTARAEQEQRRYRSLAGAFTVNLVAGIIIAVGDERPRDGALNALSGLLVSTIQTRTRPSAVSRSLDGEQSLLRQTRYGWTAAFGTRQVLAAASLHW